MSATATRQRARPSAGLAAFLGLTALAVACAEVVVPASTPKSAPTEGAPPPSAFASADPTGSAVAPPVPAAASAASAASSTDSSATAPVPSASAVAPKPARVPARVVVGEPKLEGGDVPKARAALEKLAKKLAACADAHGGLPREGAKVRVQLLVRAEGIAEGVDVLDARGLSNEARRCVRDTLQRKRVGTPSSDPVGVTVELDFSAVPAQP